VPARIVESAVILRQEPGKKIVNELFVKATVARHQFSRYRLGENQWFPFDFELRH
jgi:hypothetical protein